MARRQVAANAAALVLAYAIPRAFTFASSVVAARVLGAAAFGTYASAGAAAVVASIVATLGMQPLLVREMARAPGAAPRLLASARQLKLGTVALMALALPVLAGGVLGLPREVVLDAALLAGGYALGAFIENYAAWFQAVERMHVWTQAAALSGLITGALGIALTLATHRLVWLCAAPLVGQSAALLWLRRRTPAAVRRAPRPSPGELRALLRALAPFAIAFIGTTLYYRADLLLLSRMRPAAEVGLYGAGSRFLDIAQALALACAGALLPRLARQYAGTGAARARALLGPALLVAGPAAALLFLLRGPIVAALYGASYAGAVPVLAFLAPALAPLVLNMFALTALVAADGMAAAARAFLGATALKVALAVALIPYWGATGAAAATLLAETTLSIALVLALRERAAAFTARDAGAVAREAA